MGLKEHKLKSFFASVVAFLVIHRIYFYLQKKLKRHPPGPYCWPIVSTFFGRLLHGFKYHQILCERYGPIVIRNRFGSNNYIVDVQNSKLIRQILENKYSLSRPPRNTTNGVYISASDKNVFSFADTNGKNWQRRRQLAQSVLFRSCTAKFVNQIVDKSLISTVFPELDTLCQTKQLWYPRTLLYYIAFNSLFQANFGRSISIKDPLYIKLVDLIDKSFSLFIPSYIISQLPLLLRKIFVSNKVIDKIRTIVRERSQTYAELIEIRRKEYDSFHPTAYIDYMFNEAETCNISQNEMEVDIQALFSAGTDTTASTLEYAVVLAARHIHIQKQVQKELLECYKKYCTNTDEKVRRFDMCWLKGLTLFRAFIYEIMRISSVAKVGLPHYVTNDIVVDMSVIDGYDRDKRYVIPKDSVLLYHIKANHVWRDDENWKRNGLEMYLENWINDETGKFEINESWSTFGFGRRDCVGRQYAMKEINVVMGYLLLNYTFQVENENEKGNYPDIMDRFNGVSVIDPPIGIVVTKL
eukprot:412149_1